jgi:FG-GAP-like repeat
MGSGFGDVDNDGWLDIYLGTGDPAYEALSPNRLFRNKDGERFQDVTYSADVGHLQKGHGGRRDRCR